MTEFSSPRDFWNFRDIVRTKQRYIRNEATQQFLATVLETAKKRAVTLAAPSAFWRAQIGYEEREDDESYGFLVDNYNPWVKERWVAGH